MPPAVVVLGGGLSGMATAHALAEAGWGEITLLESQGEVGGLAGGFEHDGHFYPLGYHHILERDRTLLFFLDRIGALPRVRWRKVAMVFRTAHAGYDLSRPRDFLRFPMPLLDKVRFARLMLRAFAKSDWSDWADRGAEELVDLWAGPGVRAVMFEPLTRLKFGLPCREVSGAWLGARLHFREGTAPLGYLPGGSWTKTLCEGLLKLLLDAGVRVRTGARVVRLRTSADQVTGADLASGERLEGELFVSALPTEAYAGLLTDRTPSLAGVRYTALLSLVCGTARPPGADFYWMNMMSLDRTACGLFALNSLNPALGPPGEACLNFVTHLPGRDHPLFAASDEELTELYGRDFRALFGRELEPGWVRLSRVSMYSPVFVRSYRNPPVRSTSWRNVYFAGNYRTFPSIASTGTALGSGVEAAAAILHAHGQGSGLPGRIAAFRLRSRPRG